MPDLVGYMLLFLAVGVLFIYVHLMIGKLIRPAKPNPEKLAIYECGEPTVGSAWIQFDLRFYVVALLFVIFDVEVAFFFPWAVVFGKTNALANQRLPERQRQTLTAELVPGRSPQQPLTEQAAQDEAQAAGELAWIAFADIVVFFGVLLVGFAYLWKRGDLDWVRSTATERAAVVSAGVAPEAETPALVGAGRDA